MNLQIPKLNKYRSTPYLLPLAPWLHKYQEEAMRHRLPHAYRHNNDGYAALSYALLYQNIWRREDDVENPET